MKHRISFLLKVISYWLITFFIAKLCFLLINFGETAQLSLGQLLLVFFYSLRMDLAATAYFIALPMLLMALSECLPKNTKAPKILSGYNLLLQAPAAVVILFDAFMYRHWGYRLDIAPFMLYSQSPQEAMASALWWEILTPLIILFSWVLMAWRGNRWLSKAFPQQPQKLFALFWILTAGALIIPMRGGLQQIPINPGAGYFSDKTYANHATVNVVWNLGYTYTKWGKSEKSYRFFDNAQASAMVQSLQPQSPDTTDFQLIDTSTKPNVLLIIVESLTASVMPSLGGEPVAKGIETLIPQGILFSNFYANGDRSEEGVVAILSGYPPLPTVSAAAFPDRIHRLPSLIKDFKNQGYATEFYSGAEGSFANIGAYLLSQSIDKVVEKKDFPAAQITTKWGVHDHFVFDYVLKELTTPRPKPFFAIIETLSSHEPFDVPPPVRFPGESEADLFRNAIAYTDQSLTDFIGALQQTPAWKNLWVVIVADHGHRLPKHHAANSPQRFHIPMLWLGGALTKKDSLIKDFAAQTDIPLLIAQQMGWGSAAQYPFSKPLSASALSHAFYTYNNGFGFLTPKGVAIYDHNARANPYVDSTFLRADTLGKAYLQMLEQHFWKEMSMH